jgi:alkylhydroperoxidase family enzyme
MPISQQDHAGSRTPRITPITDPGPVEAAMIAKAPVRPDGTIRNIFLTLVRHPDLAERFNAFAGTFFIRSRLTDYERELVILRVACRARCEYEYAQHIDLAREAGIADEKILAAVEQPGSAELDQTERLLMRFTDVLFETGHLDEPLWADVAARYDEAQLIELVSLVGFYRYAADLMNVVGIQPEEPVAIPVDWLPDPIDQQI